MTTDYTTQAEALIAAAPDDEPDATEADVSRPIWTLDGSTASHMDGTNVYG